MWVNQLQQLSITNVHNNSGWLLALDTISVSPCLQLVGHGLVVLGAAQAGRALGQAGVAAPLLGRLGLYGQGVHTAAQLVAQRLVDQAVALQQGLALEALAHHQHAEVRLGARRHGVHVALVQDLHVSRLQGVRQLGPDGRLHGPGGVHLLAGVR